jgi:hypothetical protein
MKDLLYMMQMCVFVIVISYMLLLIPDPCLSDGYYQLLVLMLEPAVQRQRYTVRKAP